jgi:Domain of unknown function (DUF4062)
MLATVSPTETSAAAIRTPDQRVRVFISSTLQELSDERSAARAAVTRLRLVPVMFELAARPHPPRQVYRAYLAQSQVRAPLCTAESACACWPARSCRPPR